MAIAVKQSTYSPQELAAMLSPGMLGLQQENGKPLNLLFRPQKEADPRIKWLLEQSWYQLKLDMGVLRAVPTLEAFNELAESGMEFELTPKVYKWVTDFEVVTALDYALYDSPLFDYQKEAVRFLYSTNRAMLSLSPGLGKSLVSAFAAGLRGFDNVLLVCPASLLYYWKNELEKWFEELPRKPYSLIHHKRIAAMDEELMFPSQYWAITNPETAIKYLDDFSTEGFDCLIVDESIMYKHKDSDRSKAMKRLAQSIENVWLLTGAPATRYLDDFWHQFHILNPRGYSSYWRFAKKYCVVDDTVWGSNIVANKRDAEKAIQKNYADIYFSRNQDDVLDIPDWVFEDIDVPMKKEQDVAYETLRKELYIELDTVDPNQVITVNNHLSLMIRSIQVASNPLLVGGVDSAGKWDVLPELMEIYPGPYIIWVNFLATGEILRERFSQGDYGKLKIALANGTTKMEDRNSMVEAFQAGKLDALILNNDVGKFGFTLTKARTAFFVERTYSDAYFQCLHRNRRIGTTQSPIIVNMMSITGEGKKTVDNLIGSVLDYRNKMIRSVTSGDLKKVFEK